MFFIPFDIKVYRLLLLNGHIIAFIEASVLKELRVYALIRMLTPTNTNTKVPK